MSKKGLIITLLVPAGLVLAAASWAPEFGNGDFDQTAPVVQPMAQTTAASAADVIRLVVAPTGNVANYRVTEQFANVDFPSDAVGKTSEITGAVVIGSDGKVDAAQSKITVNVANLTSDKDRRDRTIRTRVLETDQFPNVVLVPTELRGLSDPLSAGSKQFQMIGNLTVHGVTRPTTWQVNAQVDGDQVTGTANTKFTFDDFNLNQPNIARMLTVTDTIHLQYDFTLNSVAGS